VEVGLGKLDQTVCAAQLNLGLSEKNSLSVKEVALRRL